MKIRLIPMWDGKFRYSNQHFLKKEKKLRSKYHFVKEMKSKLKELSTN